MGIQAWKSDTSYDAWITYASWYQNLKDLTEVVALPEKLRLYRGTPIAFAKGSPHISQGEQFIQFLQSPEAHAVFKKWGWE